MSNDPLVSVIIIFLNEERFLPEAIDSVFAQTYKNWELLLVDDGSHDKSTELARQYAHRYPGQVRYLEHSDHQNRGMSASRNLGINHAQGSYIAFLDADDLWLPHKLEQQVAILQANTDAAFVCGSAQWWYSWLPETAADQADFLQQFNLPLDTLVEPPAVLLLFLQDDWAALHDLLIRRDIVESVGGYEDTFRGMYEDQAFHAKICLTYPVYLASSCGYLYRQHPAACTTQSHQAGQTYAARYTFLTWLEAYIATQNGQHAAVTQVLQQELWPFKHPLQARLIGRVKYETERIKTLMLATARRLLPESARRWLWIQWHYKPWPPVGWVRFGSLRRHTPIGQIWPNYRGLPIDRYYIEHFLAQHAGAVQGHVLELADNTYTRRFGGHRVTQSDVLHAIPGNPSATIVADLTHAEHIPSDTFDCIILTQALLLIYDVRAAIETVHRILKPGGVALVTVPGITQIIRDDMEEYGQYWSFTGMSAQRLFEEFFQPAHVSVTTYGNVLAATAFLYNLAVQDLSQPELDLHDPDYEVIIGITAVKPG